MAPPLKVPEVTISNGGMSYVAKGGRRLDKAQCRWLLTSLALSLCLTALLVGLTVVYVNKELDYIKVRVWGRGEERDKVRDRGRED